MHSMATKDTPLETPPPPVKVRVLTDCAFGKADDVVMISAAEAAEGQAAFVTDSTAEAVAYAESLQTAQ